LRRDPGHENPTYEQEYEQFDFYNDAEDYVQFRSTLSDYERQAPLDTTAAKVKRKTVKSMKNVHTSRHATTESRPRITSRSKARAPPPTIPKSPRCSAVIAERSDM
jgi:hypothetical protein